PAFTSARVMSPLALLVNRVLTVRLMGAPPEVRPVPLAMEMTAMPARRSASTTPLAAVSLAIRLMAAPLVVMLQPALSWIDWPAWAVNLIPAIAMFTALSHTMSLLAWR